MKAKFLAGSALCFVLATSVGNFVGAQGDPAVVRQDVEFLASEKLAGRMTGSEGEKLAAAHLIAELERLGAVPLPGLESMRHEFEFGTGARAAETGNVLAVKAEGWTTPTLTQGVDFDPLGFTENGTVEGPVVFVGYGLKLAEDEGVPYNSYHGLDVRGKVVLALRYAPEDADQELRQTLMAAASLRRKAETAKEAGAAGLILLTGPNSPNAGDLIGPRADGGRSPGIPVISISGAVGRDLFRLAGKDLAATQKEMDSDNPHVTGFALEGVDVSISTNVVRERRKAHNVVAMFPPTTGAEAPLEAVMVGAHYDHLGRGDAGSMARSGESGMIHYGADDNASGTSAVLDIARHVAAAKERRRPVIVAFWSGEEIGLIGSTAFMKSPPVGDHKIVAYLNFDMVGRVREDQLVIQGTGSSPVWRPLIERRNVMAGFDLVVQDDPYVPTDSQATYLAGVPSLQFYSGNHEDYHRPSDTAEKINIDGVTAVASLGAAMALELTNAVAAPEYIKVERQRLFARGSGDGLRAFTGTIPDYASDVEGLKIAGVVPGGPAEKAGMLAGDVIVQFGAVPITSIYDYTSALESAKVGQPIAVGVKRGDQHTTLSLVPTARK